MDIKEYFHDRILLIKICRKIGVEVSIKDKILFSYICGSYLSDFEKIKKDGYSIWVKEEGLRFLKGNIYITDKEFYEEFKSVIDLDFESL